MLLIFLCNLIGGAVVGRRQHCLVLVPVTLAELALLAVIAGERLAWPETILLMIIELMTSRRFAPLFWSRTSTPLLALRRPH